MSCEMKLQPLIPQQIVKMQKQLAEAMELLELIHTETIKKKRCFTCVHDKGGWCKESQEWEEVKRMEQSDD